MQTDPMKTDRPENIEIPESNEAPAKPASGIRISHDRIIKASIAIIILCCILIGFFLVFLFRQNPSAGIIPDPASATDPADYTLAGTVLYVYTQSGKGLYMRSEAVSGSDVVAGIPDGSAVTVQKTLDSWAYVSWDGYEGWCSMDYLHTEEEHLQKLQEYLSIPAIVATDSSPLRLRESPSLSAETVESMPKGSSVVILRLVEDWAYVDYQGISGWCSSAYLEYAQ